VLKIEDEEYNLAVQKYKLEDSEHVLKKTKEVDERVNTDLMARLIEPLFQNPQEDNMNESQMDYFVTGEDEMEDSDSQSFVELFMGREPSPDVQAARN